MRWRKCQRFASLDNAVELLVQQGYTLDRAMLSLVPPVVGANSKLDQKFSK